MSKELAIKLNEINYRDIFYPHDNELMDAIWQGGENQDFLLQTVSDSDSNDYTRLLASEILFEKKPGYPPLNLGETLSYIYPKALLISGKNQGEYLPGNVWGFMYHTDKFGINDYGKLGMHLINTGKSAVPYLINLLDKKNILYYEGSRDATTGNALKYRVKDAAAYYIGKITGISVQYYDSDRQRDEEIKRLKKNLAKANE
ncbi:MAG: hypothetical protein ABI594_02230 [Ginsengibacter sp.]